MNMSVVLNENEKLLKEAPVSLHQGALFISGRLFLTNQRLVFEAYQGELEIEPVIVKRTEIVEVKKHLMTKTEGAIPISKEGIEVFMKDQSEYGFSLLDRDAWFALIDSKVKK